MRVLVPTIELEGRNRPLAHRPDSLEGLRIGFFDSYASKSADGSYSMYPLMSALLIELSRRYRLAGQVWRRRPNIARAADSELLDEFASLADIAIVGECASGSSVYATVHDAVEIESRGLPTITICHHQLEEVAKRHAAELGTPKLPLLVERASSNSIVVRDSVVDDAIVSAVLAALTSSGG